MKKSCRTCAWHQLDEHGRRWCHSPDMEQWSANALAGYTAWYAEHESRLAAGEWVQYKWPRPPCAADNGLWIPKTGDDTQ